MISLRDKNSKKLALHPIAYRSDPSTHRPATSLLLSAVRHNVCSTAGFQPNEMRIRAFPLILIIF